LNYGDVSGLASGGNLTFADGMRNRARRLFGCCGSDGIVIVFIRARGLASRSRRGDCASGPDGAMRFSPSGSFTKFREFVAAFVVVRGDICDEAGGVAGLLQKWRGPTGSAGSRPSIASLPGFSHPVLPTSEP